MRYNTKTFNHSQLIDLKNDDWLSKQLIAGKCVAKCLKRSKELIISKTPNLSLKDIEKECADIIDSMGCAPTFFNYNGFPGKICASVNKQIVHGIPTDYILKEGDVIKIDLGATFEGAIGDAAITAIYGEGIREHVELIEACEKALWKGIEAVKIGEHIGVIGNAISNYVKGTRFKLITKYGGHGIGWNKPHSEPFISNRAKTDEGVRIQPGMTFAIEPMLVIGSDQTKVDRDGWTVIGSGIASHFEHSLYIGEDHVHIVTGAYDN